MICVLYTGCTFLLCRVYGRNSGVGSQLFSLSIYFHSPRSWNFCQGEGPTRNFASAPRPVNDESIQILYWFSISRQATRSSIALFVGMASITEVPANEAQYNATISKLAARYRTSKEARSLHGRVHIPVVFAPSHK
ncbi:hypothetical protein EJ04DRAFT_268823 [Polyplosphaeria fusca]|uniref:Uncharacterized protein n=1 Tax=Polyplosphaeria fusca TaxID=682080 RepID=A0A9P4QYM1_9PLEO|nr:hypothetical protein EJ04DRAFT_268823 [Polyplosphaeria fusca]